MSMIIGRMQSYMRSYTIYNKDGAPAATVTTKKAKAKKNSSQKKYKKLNYNFKEISGQILRAKTSVTAGRAVLKARSRAASLRQKLYSSEYDDDDLRRAIIHADKMLRIAKKRQKHLREEENAKQNLADTQQEEVLTEGMDETEDAAATQALAEDVQELGKMNREEMKKFMQELQQQLQEMMQEQMGEDELGELAEDLTQMSHVNIDATDLEQLKKKHRQEEMRDIILADMKYLKAVFDKLAREKQEAENGVFSHASSEIGDMEMSVQTLDTPMLAQETCIDESV